MGIASRNLGLAETSSQAHRPLRCERGKGDASDLDGIDQIHREALRISVTVRMGKDHCRTIGVGEVSDLFKPHSLLDRTELRQSDHEDVAAIGGTFDPPVDTNPLGGSAQSIDLLLPPDGVVICQDDTA